MEEGGIDASWHFVAAKLGMSISEAKSSIAATEFNRWLLYYEMEMKKTNKQDYYLAQIAKTIWDFFVYFAVWSGYKDKDIDFKPLKAFLLDFDTPDNKPKKLNKKLKVKPPPETTPDEEMINGFPKRVWERMQESKAAWGSILRRPEIPEGTQGTPTTATPSGKKARNRVTPPQPPKGNT